MQICSKYGLCNQIIMGLVELFSGLFPLKVQHPYCKQFTGNKILLESNICSGVDEFLTQAGKFLFVGFFSFLFIMNCCLQVDLCLKHANCSHQRYGDLHVLKELKMNSF